MTSASGQHCEMYYWQKQLSCEANYLSCPYYSYSMLKFFMTSASGQHCKMYYWQNSGQVKPTTYLALFYAEICLQRGQGRVNFSISAYMEIFSSRR